MPCWYWATIAQTTTKGLYDADIEYFRESDKLYWGSGIGWKSVSQYREDRTEIITFIRDGCAIRRRNKYR